MYIMVTGHRPTKLGSYDSNSETRVKIKQKIKQILTHYSKDKTIIGISGMALGADMDFCHCCIDLGIEYIAYVPFHGQESMWPQASQDEYKKLLEKAKEIKIISNGSYSPKKMQIRNIAMCDDCDMAIAIFDGSKGGTYNCVSYLEKENKPYYRIDPQKL